MTDRADQTDESGDTAALAVVADAAAAHAQFSSAALGSDSFESFFIDHHTALVRALSLALGDVELGRDAASEGFVRALQRWDRVARYDNPAGWIYRVGLNWARSRRRRVVREVSSRPTEFAFASPEPDFALATALRSLSLDHRAIVVARYFLDWSEADVATALDIAPGTAKSRLSRALDHLRADLGDTTPPQGPAIAGNTS